jgi:hypothetical protein
MFWMTWRQHRTQLLVTVAALVGFLILLYAKVFTTDVIKGMSSVAPPVIGIFWGVPLLVREFDRGTYQVAWTQSVTRLRWLAVKVALVGAALVLIGLAFGLVASAWFADNAPLGMTRLGETFGATGIVPAGWFLLVFAIGAASGAVLRRMLPAMAVTIGIFAVLVVGSWLVRNTYAAPEVTRTGPPSTATVVDLGWENAAGDFVSMDDVGEVCAGQEGVGCMRERGYDQQVTYYQPDSRYWRFQWTELGLLLAGTAVFGGVAFYATSRRVGPAG